MGDNDAAAWAIVRRLAASVHLERHGSTGEIRCMYCGKLNDLHTDICLWRNAKEVLDAQG